MNNKKQATTATAYLSDPEAQVVAEKLLEFKQYSQFVQKMLKEHGPDWFENKIKGSYEKDEV